MILRRAVATLTFIALHLSCTGLRAGEADEKISVSGRYPSLAMFSHNGECGTGALAAWADRLWVITYGPHMEHGSDDKLYEIDANLNRVIRPESVGGTPADRLIHTESNQLVIGPYFIDDKRNVRAISPKVMPGRLTAALRSPTDPANKVLIQSMEGVMWEIDVKSLDAKILYNRPVPGWHSKGAYSSQGHIVITNNGETHVGNAKPHYLAGADEKDPEDAGVLADFDGKEWRIIERHQFTDVTSAGGIHGAASNDAPLWSIGWDKRSVMLKLLDGGAWHTFRLPKSDHSYDGKHGWHTEWPRIREVTGGHYLMNMHGGWFDFPKTFSAANYGGIKPLGAYLKITGDFTAWNDRIVFGCDDLAKSDFKSTGNNPLSLQSQSNLWFTTWENLAHNGRAAGWGGPWQGDAIKGSSASVPYLFGGYSQRVVHLAHTEATAVTFTLETDVDGSGKWSAVGKVEVPANGYAWHVFPNETAGQWVRVTADKDCAKATADFHYGPGGGVDTQRELFASLADIGAAGAWTGGFVHARGADKGTLAFEAQSVDGDKASPAGVYEIAPDLTFKKIDDAETNKLPIPAQQAKIEIDDASVILIEDKADGGKRFRLPKTDAAYDQPGALPVVRAIREVVTERSIVNAHGSLYVLPRPNSGGAEKMKPLCTHLKRINDIGSWRGLLALSGTRADAKPDGHFFASADGKVGLCFVDIDDLWKLGKPVGSGGPWKSSAVKAGVASDPYLMTNYDTKTISLSHDALKEVVFTIEVNVDFNGWHTYQTIKVPAGQTIAHRFPAGYSAHWLRMVSDTDCKATAFCKWE